MCDNDHFAADPSNSRVVYNPFVWSTMEEERAPPGDEWLYPWTAWPHWTASSAGPRQGQHETSHEGRRNGTAGLQELTLAHTVPAACSASCWRHHRLLWNPDRR